MLIATDIAAVNKAFTDNAARPMGEQLRAIYGDEVTIDSQGRPHAPYDGYQCPLTERIYNGGEYLPMDETEDGRPDAKCEFLHDGVAQTIYGRRAQILAVLAELVKQTRAVDAAKSQFVGALKQRLTLALTVEFSKFLSIDYVYGGSKYINVMKDDAGNVFVYIGGSEYKRGARMNMKATVKQHRVYEGVNQTLLARPAII